MSDEKQKVIDFCQSKKGKTKFYFNDFSKLFEDKKPREVKKIINEMVTEGTLEYWSSGSTTLYGLKGAGKQEEG